MKIERRQSFASALWLGFAGLAILFVLLRWNNCRVPFMHDEGEYAYAAQLLRHGLLPYEHSYLQKPPMVAYSYALADLFGPDTSWAPRMLAAVFAGLATVLLGYIARREFGPGVAMPAMWLMTPMILLPHLDQFIANTEMFMLLPLIGLMAIYVRCRHERGGIAYWLAAGAVAAMVALYKYTSLPVLALIFVVWSYEEWRDTRRPAALASRWLAALGGGMAAAAIVLAPFLLRDGGKKLWECTVVFNRFYAASDSFRPQYLWLRVESFWQAWWILFLVPWFLIFQRERRTWFWVAAFLAAWLATAGSLLPQYYVTVMPFWALLTAVALRALAGWIARNVSPQWSRLGLALTGGVVLGVIAPDIPWMIRSPAQFAADRLGPWKTFLISPAVGAELAQDTNPDDLVYVAGSEPQVMVYAHRFGATRFDIAYPFDIPTPLARGYQAEVIQDLQQHPPAAIVFVRSPSTWMSEPGTPHDFRISFSKLLANDYEPVVAWQSDGQRSDRMAFTANTDPLRWTMTLFRRKPR